MSNTIKKGPEVLKRIAEELASADCAPAPCSALHGATYKELDSQQQDVVPPEAGMDFSEYAIRTWTLQGAEFMVKNAMGEMRIDGGVRRVLKILDDERQRHNDPS